MMTIKTKTELESEYLDSETGIFADNTAGDISAEDLRNYCQDSLDTSYNDHIEASDVTYENLNTNGDVGSGATQVAIGNHTHSPNLTPVLNYADFNNIGDPAWQEGRVFYDYTNHSFAGMNDMEDVVVNIGQETFIRVRNNSGSEIANGTPVYLSGAIGNRPTIALAYLNGHPAHTPEGLTTHNIPNNTEGLVTVVGLVRGLNTNSWSEGVDLYLSTSPGVLTDDIPSAKYPYIRLGKVVVSHVSAGVILVNTRFNPDKRLGTQEITAVGNSIAPDYDRVKLTTDGSDYTLTSTPNVEAGTDGQIMIIMGNDASNTVTLQDERNLASSGLRLAGGVDFTLGQYDTITLEYDGSASLWIELGRSNNS